MKEQIIHLEPHDDIVSVRDKLGWIRAPRVLLVFPEDKSHKILQDRLDLVLLQREVIRRKSQLALITRDPIVIDHARDLGIPTFRTVDASQNKYWRTISEKQPIVREAQPVSLDQELAEAGSRLTKQNRERLAKVQRILGIILLTILLVTLLTSAYIVIPRATIYLDPAGNQVTVTTTITANPSAADSNIEHAQIGARFVGVEVASSASVETTGTAALPTESSRGIVVFTNLIPEQVTIPKGTIVRTSAAQPVRFETLVDATLPGRVGGNVEVPIIAVEPGFTGNVPSERINEVEGSLAGRVGVINTEPTRGGNVTDIQAVSEADISRVRGILLQQLHQRALAEMQSDLLFEQEFVPVETLIVAIIHSEIYSSNVGQAADELRLTMRVTIQGTAIDERLAREVVYDELAGKMGMGYVITSDTLIFRRGDVLGVDDERRVTFIMQGSGEVVTAIDPSSVQELVRGVSLREASLRLDRELALDTPPEIDIRPSFWPTLPYLSKRIVIRIAGQL
nr:baseplate J/gp47 family protein [Anaerolineae bacterium]